MLGTIRDLICLGPSKDLPEIDEVQPEDDFRLAVDKEIKRLLVDCTYSGRRHLVAGTRWASANTFLGLPIAILGAALASGAGLTALVGGNTWLTAVLAFASVVLQAAYGFMRPSERAQAHSLKGNRYIGLRNDAPMHVDRRSNA